MCAASEKVGVKKREMTHVARIELRELERPWTSSQQVQGLYLLI